MSRFSTPLAEGLKSLEKNATDSSEAEQDVPLGTLIAKSDLPCPGRTNAFELTGEFQTETAVQETGGKREIYITGFLEVDVPSVMLSIDGRTEVVKVGETFEKITVLEIDPPKARLRSDGVSWSLSIFDRRSSKSDNSPNSQKRVGAEVSRVEPLNIPATDPVATH